MGVMHGEGEGVDGRDAPSPPPSVILSLFFCAGTLCNAFYDAYSTQCQATKPKRSKGPKTLSKEA